LDSKDWLLTSVGRFSLFCENRLIPVLTACYENPIGSLIYYFCFFWAGGNQPGYQYLNFVPNSSGSQIGWFLHI
jgi:hypothetical protein